MPITEANTAAKTANTRSPDLKKTCGPGCTPCSMKAAMMMAVAPEPGMPMVSSGTMAPPTEAVAADCGATMPSAMPVPSSRRRLPYWLSRP